MHTRDMIRSWLSRSHSGTREIAALIALYGLYEVVRGGAARTSRPRSRTPANRRVRADGGHLRRAQRPGRLRGRPVRAGAPRARLRAPPLRRYRGRARLGAPPPPGSLPIVRTTFIAATALALVGYVFFPAAPPRLAALGFSDTVTHSTGLDLSSDLLGALYNPFAAVPSLHFGYALIVGVALAVMAKGRMWRIAGALYPATMLLIIVATGNHFFVDADARRARRRHRLARRTSPRRRACTAYRARRVASRRPPARPDGRPHAGGCGRPHPGRRGAAPEDTSGPHRHRRSGVRACELNLGTGVTRQCPP